MTGYSKLLFENTSAVGGNIFETVPQGKSWYLKLGAKSIYIDGDYKINSQNYNNSPAIAFEGQEVYTYLQPGKSYQLYYYEIDTVLDQSSETNKFLDSSTVIPPDPITVFSVDVNGKGTYYDPSTYPNNRLVYEVTGPEGANGVVTSDEILSTESLILGTFDLGSNYLQAEVLTPGENIYYFHLYDGSSVETIPATINLVTAENIGDYPELSLDFEITPEFIAGVSDTATLSYNAPEGISSVSVSVDGFESSPYTYEPNGDRTPSNSIKGHMDIPLESLLNVQGDLDVVVRLYTTSGRTIEAYNTFAISESSMKVTDYETVNLGAQGNYPYRSTGSFNLDIVVPNGIKSIEGITSSPTSNSNRNAEIEWDITPLGNEGDVYTLHCEWDVRRVKYSSDSYYGFYNATYKIDTFTITDNNDVSATFTANYTVGQ